MVSFCTLAVFFIPAKLYASRLKHVATMLLTAVAFQFVTSNTLPVIPYLTYLDVYFTSQFGFIIIVGVIISITLNEWDINIIEGIIALVVWLLIQLVLIFDG